MNKQIERLHRDFETGRLIAYGSYTPDIYFETPYGVFPNFARGGQFSKLIHEPICPEDLAMIGDLPIPPVLAKVDL